jgi:hypothetical protein
VQLRDDLGLAASVSGQRKIRIAAAMKKATHGVERLEGLDPEQGTRGLLGVSHIPDEGKAEPGEPARAASAR